MQVSAQQDNMSSSYSKGREDFKSSGGGSKISGSHVFNVFVWCAHGHRVHASRWRHPTALEVRPEGAQFLSRRRPIDVRFNMTWFHHSWIQSDILAAGTFFGKVVWTKLRFTDFGSSTCFTVIWWRENLNTGSEICPLQRNKSINFWIAKSSWLSKFKFEFCLQIYSNFFENALF